jgi:hypothetical protein
MRETITQVKIARGGPNLTTPPRVVSDWHSRSHSEHNPTHSGGPVAPPGKEITTLVEADEVFLSGLSVQF